VQQVLRLKVRVSYGDYLSAAGDAHRLVVVLFGALLLYSIWTLLVVKGDLLVVKGDLHVVKGDVGDVVPKNRVRIPSLRIRILCMGCGERYSIWV
jgi:hypothetical protein